MSPTRLDLENPRFLDWLNVHYPGPITPDKDDKDPKALLTSDHEEAEQYRLAQARKIMRLWREWKANQELSDRETTP
jgi:hypothetical protein